MTKVPASKHYEVASLYGTGRTMDEVGAIFGISPARVSQIIKGLSQGADSPANYRRSIPANQHGAMAEMYKAGSTLEEVGAKYQVTRERVRQIISALGVKRLDGGCAMRIFRQTTDKVGALRSKNERMEIRIRAAWGMSLDDYKAHIAEHGSCAVPLSPMHKYVQQRSNAKRRGIAWHFTFADWWRVWQQSGKWDQRGRGAGYHGYVMARWGDADTPYSPETVYICTQSQNAKDSYIVIPAAVRFGSCKGRRAGDGKGWTLCKKRKSNPFIAQFAGKQIGAFPTAELARAAYLEAVEKYKAAQAVSK